MWESLKKANEEALWALLLATVNGLRGAIPLGKTNVKKTLITGVLTRLLSIISPMESPSSSTATDGTHSQLRGAAPQARAILR